MNDLLITFFAVLSLFYFLGKAADLVIFNIRAIAEKLGIGVFFLGIILGFFTSLPELAIGLNAVIDGIPSVSLGNLLGGLMTLFSLILGANVLVNRRIEDDQSTYNFGLILLYLFLPIAFSLDGTLSIVDGVILIMAYFALLYVLYRRERDTLKVSLRIHQRDILKDFFWFLIGIVLVLLIANFIMDITEPILGLLPISPFVTGLILFALGTNFPEIIVAFRAWTNHAKDLSMSNLIGSGMANIFIIGIFSAIKPLIVARDPAFFTFAILFLGLLFTLFTFYRSGRVLTSREGAILVGGYGLFVVSQLIVAALV